MDNPWKIDGPMIEIALGFIAGSGTLSSEILMMVTIVDPLGAVVWIVFVPFLNKWYGMVTESAEPSLK
jgi:hypothetical protein